ncbi:MAG: SdpI family protein [Bacillota bacterium]|jgi:uncharacterized membrane protein
MNVFLFFTSILVPFTMALIGARFRKNPPKRVNWFFGYRTSRSMKSQEAWDYANRRMGEVWWGTGLVTGIASVLVAAFCWRILESAALWLIGFQMLVMLSTVVIIERDLKRKFDE